MSGIETPPLVFDGPAVAERTIALAHGAGAAMDSPFLTYFARGLADQGFRVARFEFPYMAARRRQARARTPDPPPVLLSCWRSVIAALGGHGLLIGGKSLGGRMASMVADEMVAGGLICLGYPFHPPGRPNALRTEHLKTLKTPTLILQGTRDLLGNKDEVAGYTLSPAIRVHWLDDGDHGFKPRRASGRTAPDNWNAAIAAIAAFVADLPR